MRPDEIQKRALKTWYPEGHELHSHPLHPVIALVGEAGEVLNLLKKHRYKPGFRATSEDFTDELGDILYYLAILAYQFGLTLDQLSRLNREKLKDGKHGWPETEEYEDE